MVRQGPVRRADGDTCATGLERSAWTWGLDRAARLAYPSGVFRRSSRIAATSPTARSTSSLTTTASKRSASASSASARASRRSRSAGSSPAVALEQAAALLLPGRRPDEHEQRLRERLPYGERALDVELEQHVVAGGEGSSTGARGVPFRSP